MYYNVGDIMNDKIISVRIMPEGYGKASKEVRDYILSLHDEIVELQQENERLKLNHKQLKDIEKMAISNSKLIQENERLKEANKILEENWKHYMMICGKASEKSQELKDSIDKSNFDGMTKTILILGINQIQNILQNGSEEK